MKKVLFVSAHPDDETIGCGGTILYHKSKGDEIYWLILTNVDEKHGWDKKIVNNRQKEIEKVNKLYGFNGLIKLDFPTTKLDSIPYSDIITSVSTSINAVKPEIIYLPNRSDIHTDHQITFNAIYACTKSFRNPFIKKVLMYETLSETEFAPALIENVFVPNVFIDVSHYFDKKIEAMKIYSSEIMPDNFPRSLNAIESLAGLRGSRICVKYAESFMLIFEQQ